MLGLLACLIGYVGYRNSTGSGSCMLDIPLFGGGGASQAASLDGTAAPSWQLASFEGETVASSDYRGKTLVLNFWATYCGSCTQEVADLAQLDREHNQADLAVAGIVLDDPAVDDLLAFCERKEISYPMLRGNETVAGRFGGIRTVPTTFVISPGGTIVEVFQGRVSKASLEAAIAAARSGF